MSESNLPETNLPESKPSGSNVSDTKVPGANVSDTELSGSSPRAGRGPKSSWWVTIGLLVALVALFVIPMLVAPAPPDGEEGFGGTDSAATQIVEETGYEPWAEPVLDLGSGELESGLFALQAGVGGLILGVVLGRLSARRRTEEAVAAVRAELTPGTERR